MFDRFSDHARMVMGHAHQGAQRYHHDYIGTEHLLLGLLRTRDAVGLDALRELNVDLAQLHQEVERRMTSAYTLVTMGQLPFTPRAKKVLELALEEARNFGHNYIGTEHLLLGLVGETEGIGAEALRECGVELVPAREVILDLLCDTELRPKSSAVGDSEAAEDLPATDLHEELARVRERIRKLEERVQQLQDRE